MNGCIKISLTLGFRGLLITFTFMSLLYIPVKYVQIGHQQSCVLEHVSIRWQENIWEFVKNIKSYQIDDQSKVFALMLKST